MTDRDKSRSADDREGREGADPKNIPQPGPDGTVHLMEIELLANALTKDAPPDQPPDSRVIHVMELQMKGEALADMVSPIDPPPEDAGRKGESGSVIGAGDNAVRKPDDKRR